LYLARWTAGTLLAARKPFQPARYMRKPFQPERYMRKPFQPARYMYRASWKEAVPSGEVDALPAGRKPFQPARMCLASHLKGGYPRIPARRFPRKKQMDIRMRRGHL
jgi:hypothetical protein